MKTFCLSVCLDVYGEVRMFGLLCRSVSVAVFKGPVIRWIDDEEKKEKGC